MNLVENADASRPFKRSKTEFEVDDIKLSSKCKSHKLVMKNSTLNRKHRSKPKDNFDPGVPEYFGFIETKRKSSLCDSNDSGLNSPRSLESTSGSTSISEAEELNMFELDMEFASESDLTEIDPPLSFVPQVNEESHLIASRSLPHSKPAANKHALYKSQQQHKSSTSPCDRNGYSPLTADPSAPTPYRGGRKKEVAPLVMSEEERRHWEKERVKKDNHNIIEKRRRYKINDCITEIGRLLPTSCDVDVLNKKGTILQTSIEYIRKLQAERVQHQELQQKLEMLENVNEQLKEELEATKVQVRNLTVERLVVAAGNNFHLVQDANLSLFDVAINQPIKQELKILRDSRVSFQNVPVSEHLDFSGDQTLQQEFLNDQFIFLKNENQDSSQGRISQRLHASESSSSPLNNSDFCLYNATATEDFSQPSKDLETKSFETVDPHSASIIVSQSNNLLAIPSCESFSHSLINNSHQEGLNFYSSMFLEQFDSSFHNISDVALGIDSSLYPVSHDFVMRDDDLTMLN